MADLRVFTGEQQGKFEPNGESSWVMHPGVERTAARYYDASTCLANLYSRMKTDDLNLARKARDDEAGASVIIPRRNAHLRLAGLSLATALASNRDKLFSHLECLGREAVGRQADACDWRPELRTCLKNPRHPPA